VSQKMVSEAGAIKETPDTAQVRTGLGASLRQDRNSDGGWAYSAGKRSRLEPTCWALLALAAADARPVDVERVRTWPRHDGWLVDVAGAPPNQAFNALAALTLLQDASTAPLARPVVSNLLSAKGERYSNSNVSPEDATLQAWSWVEGTASWVEPTAWSLLLLKKLRSDGSLPREGTLRIEAGEQLLLDRVCSVGGWNYGNRQVYGHDLWPYVPTTALALLALQDRRDLSSVKRSLEQMQKDLLTERSTLALALARVCLKVYAGDARRGNKGATDGIPGSESHPANAGVERELARLAARDLETPGQNVLGQAIALYALSDPARAPKIFSF
jgi:hypothetical protein